MRSDFLPRRQADLLIWSGTFCGKLRADPARWGVSAAEAQACADLHAQFAAAWQRVQSPDTRSPAAIVAKDECRDRLIERLRRTAARVRATETVTDALRVELGLKPRRTGQSHPAAPDQPPALFIRDRLGQRVTLALRQGGGSEHRGRPASAAGAQVWSFVGTTPPVALDEWHFRGNFTRPEALLHFSHELPPGTKVWLTARWYNRRGQSGPAATPITTWLAGGGMAEPEAGRSASFSAPRAQAA